MKLNKGNHAPEHLQRVDLSQCLGEDVFDGVVLGIKPRAICTVGKCSTTEPRPQSKMIF